MRFRGILFLATLALTLSPGVGADAATVIASQTSFAVAQSCVLGGSPATSNSHQKIRFPSVTQFDAFTLDIWTTAAATGLFSLQVMQATFEGPIIATSFNSIDVSTLPTSEATAIPFQWVFSSPVTLAGGVNYYIGTHPLADPVAGAFLANKTQNVSANFVFVPATGYDATMLNGCGTAQGTDIAKAFLFTMESGVFVTANEIVVPFDGETITAVPFQIQGTCNQSEEPNLRVVITHADLGFIEERIVACIADAWAAPDMGAALFNDDFVVTLSADNFVELPFDTHDFTVDEPNNPTPGPPQAGVQCAGISNLFLEGLCDILAFLFVPNTQTLQAIGNLFDELQDKPPLGFLTAALDAFDTLEQGVSSEELDGTADLNNFFDPIKTTFSALLWMLFAVFLIRRVSTIRI